MRRLHYPWHYSSTIILGIQMKNGVNILLLLVSLSYACMGCKKLYAPKAAASVSNYLVVEGMINTGADSTIIRLSRTVPLASKTTSRPELHAIVTLQSDAGDSYIMTESGSGYYKAPGFNTAKKASYELKIATAEGEAYQSDMVPAKTSPPIDSVYYRVKSDGVQVYADTHDPANATRYYRWDYNETYQYRSAFESYFYHARIPQDTIVPRPQSDGIFVCYRSDTSSSIILNTSEKLAVDIITQNPVTFIASTSEKLESRYSILVKQYALSEEAFNYFQQLKKNTEQLGSVFDPQPSELPGNIHCLTDPAEAVLGYITAGRPSEARIFIDNRYLPAWHASTPYEGCKIDTDLYKAVLPNGVIENDVQINLYSGYEIPLYAVTPPTGVPILGFGASIAPCVDCTLRGTNKKPAFWQDAAPGSVY
ncbi:MAG: DUF4249 domain-containing protein [Bacteroidetes bacterium]|nr:DUF4249 domain-containing protein [Bacteroidota bacterium]